MKEKREREYDDRSNSTQYKEKRASKLNLVMCGVLMSSICQTVTELLRIVLNTCGVITK